MSATIDPATKALSSSNRNAGGVRADEEENESAFLMHSQGFLKMVGEMLNVKGLKLTPQTTTLKSRTEEVAQLLQSAAATRKANGVGATPTTTSAQADTMATANNDEVGAPAAASEPMSTSVSPERARRLSNNAAGGGGVTSDNDALNASESLNAWWIDAQRSNVVSDVLVFVEKDLITASLPNAADTTKLRKIARDLLQLILVRATAMLSHRLPLLVELAVSHAFFRFYRSHTDSRRQSPTAPSQKEFDQMMTDESQEEVDLARAEETLSDSVSSIVQQEELALKAADPVAALGGNARQLFDALMIGVMSAERCLLRSLEILSQFCPPSSLSSSEESISIRVVAKSCAEVIRSLKVLHSAIHQRLGRVIASYVTPEGTLTGRFINSSNFVIAVPSDELIAEAVTAELGIDTCRLLSNYGFEVCRTACNYLVQVVSVPGTQDGLGGASVKNKTDAKLILFRLMDYLLPVDRSIATSSSQSLVSTESSSSPAPAMALSQSSSASHVSSSGLDRMKTVKNAIVQQLLPTTPFTDFVAAIGRYTGDENDGQLLCVKLLTDGLQLVCGRDVDGATPAQEVPSTASAAAVVPVNKAREEILQRELSSMMRMHKHRRSIFAGVLNALVSVHRSVLAAGLTTLEVLNVQPACLRYAAQEIGFIYSNAVVRLLESDNCTQELKVMFVHHFQTSFLGSHVTTMTGSSVIIGQHNNHQEPEQQQQQQQYTPSALPLLIVFYRLFDLNRRLHQVHIVQQMIAALARVVRLATPQELTAPLPGTPNGGSGEAQLPQLCLSALISVSELLAEMLPHDAVPLELIRDITMLRDEKVEDQRMLDVINNAPCKGVCKRFFIDKEMLEQRPELTRKLSSSETGESESSASPVVASPAVPDQNLEYSMVPPPPNQEVASKARAIAEFLLHTPALNPLSIGEFLTEPKYFPLQVCKEFMSSLDLNGRSITSALSEMLSVLQLPKEGQRIERLLEFFTHAYYNANTTKKELFFVNSRVGNTMEEDSGASPRFEDRILIQPPSVHFPFATSDACFIVVVATVMLNTDLHNPRVSSKMTRDAFRSQLRGCNDGKDFPVGFADGIFDSIHKRPLSNVKGLGATSLNGGSHVSTALPPAGTMDMLFFSASERKELMFGMERQRLVMETRELLSRRSTEEGAVLDELWQINERNPAASTPLAVVRDLFLCVWPSISVLLNVATTMCTSPVTAPPNRSPTPPSDLALVKAILRGLESCILLGTALKLHTEADLALSTIQKLMQPNVAHRSVIDLCMRCMLRVAATEHCVNLSANAWSVVMQALVDIKRTPSNASLVNEAEAVFSLMEVLVARAAGASFSLTCPASKAMHMTLTCLASNATASRGDGITLGAHLYVMKRLLVYSLVVNRTKRTTVERRIAMPLFLSVFGRSQWYALLQAHGESNECLQLIHETYAELVSEVWSTAGPGLLAVGEDGLPSAEAHEEIRQFFECFAVVAEGMKRAAASPGVATPLENTKIASTIRIHVLQAVKTIMSSTIMSTARVVDRSRYVALPIAMRVWTTLLGPLTIALSHADMIASENCALGVLVLRHIVVAWCGNAAGAASAVLPSAYRDGLGFLLAHVSYIGAMCADANNAHSCLSQLTTLVTTVLNNPDATSAIGGSTPSSPISRETTNMSTDLHQALEGISNDPRTSLFDRLQDSLLSTLVDADDSSSASHDASLVAHCVVERLCLLLRCEKQSLRQEAAETLKNIPLLFGNQMVALQHYFLHVSSAVLEATLGHADANHKTCIVEPCVVSFPLFGVSVPPSLKRCSKTSFTATLPLVLHAVANDVLPSLPHKHVVAMSLLWTERCLVVLALSPRQQSHAMRILALRALIQTLQAVADREKKLPFASSTAAQPPHAAVRVDSSSSQPGPDTTDTPSQSHEEHAWSRILSIVTFLLHSMLLLIRNDEFRSLRGEVDRQLLFGLPSMNADTTTFQHYSATCTERLAELEDMEAAFISGIDELYDVQGIPRVFANVVQDATAATAQTTSAAGNTPRSAGDDRSYVQSLWSMLPLLVAPLPRLFQSPLFLSTVSSGSFAVSSTIHDHRASQGRWTIPSSSVLYLRTLLVECVNHALVLHTVFLSNVATDKDLRAPQLSIIMPLLSLHAATNANSSNITSGSAELTMHPHAVVRGALMALFFLELEAAASAKPFATGVAGTTVSSHFEELLSIVHRAMEQAAAVQPTSSAAGASTANLVSSSTGINAQIIQLARTCSSGMVAELAVVVSSVVSQLDTKFRSMTHDEQRSTSLLRCVASTDVFDKMVTLLSPSSSAASIILSVKKYLLLFRELECPKLMSSRRNRAQSDLRETSHSSHNHPNSGLSSPVIQPAVVSPSTPQEIAEDDDIVCSESTVRCRNHSEMDDDVALSCESEGEEDREKPSASVQDHGMESKEV